LSDETELHIILSKDSTTIDVHVVSELSLELIKPRRHAARWGNLTAHE